MHAPLTLTKQRVIDAGASDAEVMLAELVKSYPGDCIATPRLCRRLWGDEYSHRDASSLRYIAERLGVRAYPVPLTFSPKRKDRVRILRNSEQWMGAEPEAICAEVTRGEDEEDNESRRKQ